VLHHANNSSPALAQHSLAIGLEPPSLNVKLHLKPVKAKNNGKSGANAKGSLNIHHQNIYMAQKVGMDRYAMIRTYGMKELHK